MAKSKKLPKEIEEYLDKSLLFNKFGLVNLAVVKANTNTTLSDEELKKLIQARFGKEMSNGKVEFLEKTMPL